MADEVLYEARDAIGYVTFNRPQARNALTFAMYERLAEVAAEPGDVRALVVSGAGDRAFAAGTDIGQFRTFGGAEDAIAYEARLDRVLSTLERCRVPTIAAIAGACTGGGAGIAAACDLRIAAANARFGFPIARTLGNCLSMGNIARLAALIGAGRVTEMIFTARLLDAEEARSAGLVSEVLPDARALARRAAELANLVASHAPLTLRATKEALRRLRDSLPPDE
ncbi:MAG: enoyl-CoA hydratase/isomerase family protein, partial [Acetobacteraceae bacterium]|nr:enoyl-CoA hydratase/isomerase family protein [Acetobacteraceae bacterium]